MGPNKGSKLDRIDGADENIFSLRLRSDAFGKWTSSAIVADPLTPCWVSGFEHQESSHSGAAVNKTCRNLNKSFTVISCEK